MDANVQSGGITICPSPEENSNNDEESECRVNNIIFEDRDDAFYQIPPSLLKSTAVISGSVLNMDVINECAPIPALKLGENLRRLILALYAKFISSDGRAVDYDGIKGYSYFFLFHKLLIKHKLIF